MATTLIINPGSSSKKYALYKNSELLLTMRFESTESGYELCTTIHGEQQCLPLSQVDFDTALAQVLKTAEERKCIGSKEEVTRVGIRIVAPGTFFQTHRIIDASYIELFTQVLARAPLHIPVMEKEIQTVLELLPNARFVGVSDSFFHRTLPKVARDFSISPGEAEKYDIYRFGYHGLSVASVVRQLPAKMGFLPERLIVCHVGSGVSVTAVRAGESIDTTMGFTPGGGLIMSTRAGDLEASALVAYLEASGVPLSHAHSFLQQGGGFKARSGVHDLRILIKRYHERDHEAVIALEQFIYKIQLAIGGYVAALGGIDALIFTATATERNPTLRALIIEGLEGVHLSLDSAINETVVGRSACISTPGVIPAVYVLQTDEMGEMLKITESM